MAKEKPKQSRRKRTIESLRLDLKEAENGRPWLLLPEGFRDQDSGRIYPLPTNKEDLRKLAIIPIQPYAHNSGSVYIRRATKKWQEKQKERISAINDVSQRQQKIQVAQYRFTNYTKELKSRARKAVEEVQKEAQQAIANLSDLFSLGRKGIDGQMRAHLEGREWQGEIINAKAFRECFRMVAQAVKGLGLPSDQRTGASDAVMEEVAAALKDTQETVALAPGTDPETEH